MPKSPDEKRLDAIRRELKYWNADNYIDMPLNIRMIVRGAYLNLSLRNKAVIAEELKLKFGTGKILFME